MGIINVFKKLGSGLKTVGGGIADGVGHVADHMDNPVFNIVLSLIPGAGSVKDLVDFGRTCVRNVDDAADNIKAAHKKLTPAEKQVLSDKKRDMFAVEFRTKYPDASVGDVSLAAALFNKLENQVRKEGERLQVSIPEKAETPVAKKAKGKAKAKAKTKSINSDTPIEGPG